MKKEKFFVGQKLKNSPNDSEAMFKIISIQSLLSGLKCYTVQNLYNESDQFILHENDLYPIN